MRSPRLKRASDMSFARRSSWSSPRAGKCFDKDWTSSFSVGPDDVEVSEARFFGRLRRFMVSGQAGKAVDVIIVTWLVGYCLCSLLLDDISALRSRCV